MVGVGVAGGAWRRYRVDALPLEVTDLIAQGQQAMRLSLLETDRQAAQLFEQAAGAAPVHARAWGLLAVARQQMSRHCPIGWSACLAAQPKRWVSLTAPLSACLARSAA